MIKWYFKLNYFHGSMLVLQHLRSALLREYLTFSEREHQRHPNLEQDFRNCIMFTCEEIRNDCYKGVFHHMLPSLYRFVCALVYIVLEPIIDAVVEQWVNGTKFTLRPSTLRLNAIRA